MLAESAHKYLSRLLLNFSDLCDTDAEIAECLTFMRVSPPVNVGKWTSETVRQQMPLAYTTVCHASEYASQSNDAVNAYCNAVYKYINSKGNQ